MFGKKNNKVKKEKWWKNKDDNIELESIWGTKYKLASGFSILFFIGMILLAISLAVLKPNPEITKETWTSLFYVSIAIIIVSVIGTIITISLKIKEQKRYHEKIKRENNIEEMMILREKEYENSLNNPEREFKRLETSKQRRKEKKEEEKSHVPQA
ncbi:MAG: hypothetical protein LBF02_02870 [Mycoplasmataceae bacterium]|nr:hypothetical protein [Mycoplasmataceae bacterium]